MSTYPPEIDAYIESKIASGQFRSRDDFAIEAAKLYRDFETQRSQVKAQVEAGLAELSGGHSGDWDIDDIIAEILTELRPNGEPA